MNATVKLFGTTYNVKDINGELVEAGRFGRIELPEVEVAKESTEDAEMIEFNNEVAAMINAENTPAVETTVEALRQMILDGIRGGQDFDAAYASAVAAMVALDHDAMARMATHIIQGER